MRCGLSRSTCCQGPRVAKVHAGTLESFLPIHRWSGLHSDAEESSMAIHGVIQHSNGRVIYPCGSLTKPPTNPKAGSPTSGNTVVWSSRTRATTLMVPRQNPVNVDTWSPQSKLRTYSGPITYTKPPFRQAATDIITAARNNSVSDLCAKNFQNPCVVKTGNR